VDELDDRIQRLEALARGQSNNRANSNITVNAGGMGVWIATTACLIMLVISIGMMFLLMEERAVNRDQMHQLNAIYQYAPQLRPAKSP
jgi:hypothetical protein